MRSINSPISGEPVESRMPCAGQAGTPESRNDCRRTRRADGQAGAYNGGAWTGPSASTKRCSVTLRSPKFFGLAGAMAPAGTGGIVKDLVDAGHIDVACLDRREPHPRHYRGDRAPSSPRRCGMFGCRTETRGNKPDLRYLPPEDAFIRLGVHAGEDPEIRKELRSHKRVR